MNQSVANMSYALIDSIIRDWTGRNSLHLYTRHRDEEVRSVDIVGEGQKCQIWIDPPTTDGEVAVHIWDYRKRREDRVAGLADLSRSLDQAYATAMKWTSGQ